MQSELLAAFEERVAELRERVPRLRGEPRREAVAQLESMTEFLELIDLIGGGRMRSASRGGTSTVPAA
jgi:hypothetical protein